MSRLIRSLSWLCVLLICGALIAWPRQPAHAQTGSTAYPLHLTRDALERIIQAWDEQLPYIPGEVLVKFRPGTAASAQSKVLSLMRGAVDQSETTWIGDILHARTTGEPDAALAASILERQPEVEWAQPNHWIRLQSTPNDPSYSRQWNFTIIDMPRAWDINPGATSSVVVAVVDSGVTTATASHPMTMWSGGRFETVSVPVGASPDLASTRITPGKDFVFWTGPVLDFDGHGTHVAGTILQETNNNVSLAGIAYGAKLMPLKVCLSYWDLQFAQAAQGVPGFRDPRLPSGCPTSAIVEGIRFAADNGAHIANLSLGGTSPSPAVLDAVRYAVGKGVFVSISAGNEFERGNPVTYPASYAAQIDGAVAVGAVGRSQRRASYSSAGTYVEFAAPGGDQRDGGTTGLVYQVGLVDSDFNPFATTRPRFNRYTEVGFQGTSMAAPHVAGLAALLRSQGITNPAAIEAALRQFARDLGTPGRDIEYGHGLIDARATLRGLGVAK